MVADEHKNWKIGKKMIDMEFVRNSIREELEAINNYQARIEETDDAELRHILNHNMDEEKEHTAMLTEWLQKNDKKQGEAFKKHD
jgi:hypothetical protein